MTDESEHDGGSAAREGTPIAVPLGSLVKHDDDDGDASPPLVEQTGEPFAKISRAAAAKLIKVRARTLKPYQPTWGEGMFISLVTAAGLYVVGNSQADKVGLVLALAMVGLMLLWPLAGWLASRSRRSAAARELVERTGWSADEIQLGLEVAADARETLAGAGWHARRVDRGVVRAVQYALSEREAPRGKALKRIARYGSGSQRKRGK